MIMDTLDGLLTFESLVLASQQLEPYILQWAVGDAVDGEAECSVLPVMRREEGVLLVMPGNFLPEEVVAQGNSGAEGAMFGPSRRFEVPGVILDGGVINPTGSTLDVLVVDCLPEVAHHLRRFAPGEEIVHGFDDESPYALPSIDALLPLTRQWLAEIPDLGAFYTPDGEQKKRRRLPVNPDEEGLQEGLLL